MDLLDVYTLDGTVNQPIEDPNAGKVQPPPFPNVEPRADNASSSAPWPNTIAAIEHVRLPSFWRHSPQQWFIHAEAIFHSNRVRSDLTKVNHVLTALDADGIRTVADLLGADAQYSVVRNRLISAYAVPQATRFRSIVQPGGMGDRRPSQMLRDMRGVLPEGIGDAALKEFWLQKLPPAILTVISGLDGSLDSLAERADRVMDASTSREISAVSDHCCRSMESAFAALTAQIAALVTSQSTQNRQPRSGNRSRTRSRTRSQSRQRNKDLCYYHDRFGKDAKNCRDPCNFNSKNC